MVQPGLSLRQAASLEAERKGRPKPPTETEAESRHQSARGRKHFDSWHAGCPSEPSEAFEVEVGPFAYAGTVNECRLPPRA